MLEKMFLHNANVKKKRKILLNDWFQGQSLPRSVFSGRTRRQFIIDRRRVLQATLQSPGRDSPGKEFYQTQRTFDVLCFLATFF